MFDAAVKRPQESEAAASAVMPGLPVGPVLFAPGQGTARRRAMRAGEHGRPRGEEQA